MFIPELLQKKLLVYIEKKQLTEGFVFVTRNGNPVNRSNVWAQMKRLCGKTGIPESKVFPHNLRHLFARTYYTRERDITRLADVLGHSSIETTRVYTISTGKEHEKQLSALGLVV